MELLVIVIVEYFKIGIILKLVEFYIFICKIVL